MLSLQNIFHYFALKVLLVTTFIVIVVHMITLNGLTENQLINNDNVT